MTNKWLKNKTVQNAGWLIIGRVAQFVINFFVGLLTARYLGPAKYGLLNYAAAYTAFFSAFCTLGIRSVIVKEFIDAPEKEGEVLGTSLFLQGVSSILSAVVILCIVYVADEGDPTTMAVVFFSTIGMVLQTAELFNRWFQARLKSKVTAIVSLLAYIIASAYKIFLLIQGKSVIWFAVAVAIDYLCIAVLMLAAYRKHGGMRLKLSLDTGRDLLRKSCHFILPGIMVAVYAQTDKIMLKQMLGENEIGFYSTAVSLCNVWCFVLQAIIDAMYPEITKAYGKNGKLFEKRNRQLYAIIFYVSVFVSLCFTCLAKPVIHILYGQQYLPAVAPLRVVTWYTAFSYLGVARNAWIVCKGRQRYLKYVYASAAISNVVLNFVLIPVWGTVGAAIASLAAQVITTMVAPFFIRQLRENAVLMTQAIFLKGVREENDDA